MTGIVGFVSENAKSITKLNELMSGERVYSQRQAEVSLDIFSQHQSIAVEIIEESSIELVLWGDIFAIAGSETSNQEALHKLKSAYINGELKACLGTASGYFVLVVNDKSALTISIASDKLGMKPVYLWQDEQKLQGFSSELKALLAHPSFEFDIDHEGVKCFGDVGHYLALDTAYNNIKRLPPASICTFDYDGNKCSQHSYWSWQNIRPNKQISFHEALAKMGELFEKAMQQSFSKITGSSVAITLSGGLDSRVLLAAAKRHFKGDIYTFTFGEAGCQDQVIAQQVATLAGSEHHFIEINQSNWFSGREQGVWSTDGLKNVLHMHALKALPLISSKSHFLLNGFLGDVTAGGSYLCSGASESTTLTAAQGKFKHHASHADFDQGYFSDSCSDAILVYNRGVRFISAGSDLLASHLHQLKPFVENEFMEFMYSLPEDYRRNGRIYHHMLLDLYPEYFATIPWQQTGKPISKNTNVSVSTATSVKGRIKQWIVGTPIELMARKLYRKLAQKHHYVAYDTWLREPSFKHYVETLVLDTESELLNQQLSFEQRALTLKKYYEGDPNMKAESIGGLLTLALFAQQVSKVKQKTTI